MIWDYFGWICLEYSCSRIESCWYRESEVTACEIFSTGTRFIVTGEVNDVVVAEKELDANGDDDSRTNDSFNGWNPFPRWDFVGWLFNSVLWLLIYCCRYWCVSSDTWDRFGFWGSSKSLDCRQCGQYTSCWPRKRFRMMDL